MYRICLFSPSHIASASRTSARLVAAATALAIAAPALADSLHDKKIKTFAGTIAIARTFRHGCPGMTYDEGMLEAIQLRLNIVEADHSAFALQAHAAAEMLTQGLAEAPSRQAWCDTIFGLYRPAGKLLRGMLRR